MKINILAYEDIYPDHSNLGPDDAVSLDRVILFKTDILNIRIRLFNPANFYHIEFHLCCKEEMHDILSNKICEYMKIAFPFPIKVRNCSIQGDINLVMMTSYVTAKEIFTGMHKLLDFILIVI